MHEDLVFEEALARAIDERAARMEPPRSDRVARSIAGGRRRRAARMLVSGLAAGAVTLGVAGVTTIAVDDGRSPTDGVVTRRPSGDASGRVAYAKVADGRVDIYFYDLGSGRETRVTSEAGTQTAPAWSPDGTRIVFQGYRASSGANDGIFTVDVATGSVIELNSGVSGMEPAWSPDGTKIAFANATDGAIWAMGSDGSRPTRLSDGPSDGSPQWSPDGSEIAFIRNGSLYVMRSDGTGQTTLTSTEREAYPAWSPDGTKIALTRLFEGSSDIFVVSADGAVETRVPTGEGEDWQPEWSPDGSELLYVGVVDGDGVLFVVEPDGSGKRRVVPVAGSLLAPDWAPTP